MRIRARLCVCVKFVGFTPPPGRIKVKGRIRLRGQSTAFQYGRHRNATRFRARHTQRFFFLPVPPHGERSRRLCRSSSPLPRHLLRPDRVATSTWYHGRRCRRRGNGRSARPSAARRRGDGRRRRRERTGGERKNSPTAVRGLRSSEASDCPNGESSRTRVFVSLWRCACARVCVCVCVRWALLWRRRRWSRAALVMSMGSYDNAKQ